MLPYPKKLTFAKYSHEFLPLILSSEFSYLTPNNLPTIQRLRINIYTKRAKRIHSFYLWLLTGQKPFRKKFHLSQTRRKRSSSKSLQRKKIKSKHVQITIQSGNTFFVLRELLFSIVTKQMNYEKPIWRFRQKDIQLSIPIAPLTYSTVRLKTKNNYFPNIFLRVGLTFSPSTAFQRLFLAKALKLIHTKPQLKGLETFENYLPT